MLKVFGIICLVNTVVGTLNTPVTPCPDYFQYVCEGNYCHGKITLNHFYANPVILELKLVQSMPVFKGNYGKMIFAADESNLDEGCVVYRVEFPLQNDIPTVKRIILNGRIVCQQNLIQNNSRSRQVIQLYHTLNYDFPKSIFRSGDIQISHVFQKNKLKQNDVLQEDAQQENDSSKYTPSTPSIQIKFPSKQDETQGVLNKTEAAEKIRSVSGIICSFSKNGSHYLNKESPNDNGTENPFPWVAGIFRKGSHGLNFTCDGSLISSQSVLTSAECLEVNSVTFENAVIFLGWNMLDSSNGGEVVIRETDSIIVHPDYYKSGPDGEVIAVMHLKKPISFTRNIHPICLWSDTHNRTSKIN